VPAGAQLFRAYLAPNGSDANACTLPAPCRLLPAALNAVADGGEIWMLDSANYNTGPVNVTKSVTILAVPGALGSVLALGGPAFNVATPGVELALRNLVIVPLPGGNGTNGIYMTAGAALTIDDCLFANLPAEPIYVNADAVIRITDSTIRDGGGEGGVNLSNGARATVTRTLVSRNSGVGIMAFSSLGSSTTSVDVADSTVDGSSYGVYARSVVPSGVVKVSVRRSGVIGHGLYGVAAQSDGGAPVTVSLSASMVVNNATGVAALGAGSKVWASGNMVTNNTLGLLNSAGLFESAGNNAVRNNATAKSGTITVVSPLE
jgi:hypothetical protein